MSRLRSAYSPRVRHKTKTGEASKAVQYFKEQCDVNNILAKHKGGGPLFSVTAQPRYEDFSDVVDYQSAQNALIRAQESFHALPAAVRQRFNNSPAAFLEFAQNAQNLEEMRQMGLAPEAKEIPPALLEKEATESAG